jgi:hypothetical protein
VLAGGRKRFASTLLSASYPGPRCPYRPQDDAAKGLRPKVTLLDVADRATDPKYAGNLFPTSPRSVEACLRLGIDPNTLAQRPYEHYLKRERDADLAQLAFEYEERLRQVQQGGTKCSVGSSEVRGQQSAGPYACQCCRRQPHEGSSHEIVGMVLGVSVREIQSWKSLGLCANGCSTLPLQDRLKALIDERRRIEEGSKGNKATQNKANATNGDASAGGQ